MSDYMNPPPLPSVVIVQNDVGGEFYSYLLQTEKYRKTNQKIVLISCRSACTMALSLKNVCVYPHSVLAFHAAYYEDSKEIAKRETNYIFSMYPKKVQERLSSLEKDFKKLSGSELIKLGVKACSLKVKPVSHKGFSVGSSPTTPTILEVIYGTNITKYTNVGFN